MPDQWTESIGEGRSVQYQWLFNTIVSAKGFTIFRMDFAETRALRESRSIYFWPTRLVESSLSCRFPLQMWSNWAMGWVYQTTLLQQVEGLCRLVDKFGYRGISPAGSKELQWQMGAFAYASCKIINTYDLFLLLNLEEKENWYATHVDSQASSSLFLMPASIVFLLCLSRRATNLRGRNHRNFC